MIFPSDLSVGNSSTWIDGKTELDHLLVSSQISLTKHDQIKGNIPDLVNKVISSFPSLHFDVEISVLESCAAADELLVPNESLSSIISERLNFKASASYKEIYFGELSKLTAKSLEDHFCYSSNELFFIQIVGILVKNSNELLTDGNMNHMMMRYDFDNILRIEIAWISGKFYIKLIFLLFHYYYI